MKNIIGTVLFLLISVSGAFAEMQDVKDSDSFEGTKSRWIESKFETPELPSSTMPSGSVSFSYVIFRKQMPSGKMNLYLCHMGDYWIMKTRAIKVKINNKIYTPKFKSVTLGAYPAISIDPSSFNDALLKSDVVLFRFELSDWPHKQDFEIPGEMLGEWKEVIRRKK